MLHFYAPLREKDSCSAECSFDGLSPVSPEPLNVPIVIRSDSLTVALTPSLWQTKMLSLSIAFLAVVLIFFAA